MNQMYTLSLSADLEAKLAHYPLVLQNGEHPKEMESLAGGRKNGRHLLTLGELKEQFWKTIIVNENGCWIWTGYIGDKGYGIRMLFGKRCSAPRLAWWFSRGPIQEGLMVCHKCDVRACINPQHLFLGTAMDNNVDMAKKGRQHCKLSHDDVRAIRSSTEGQTSLARKYGVRISTIWFIRTRKIWKHLP